MKRLLTIVAIVTLCTACLSTQDIISKKTANAIPEKATKALVNSKLPADSLYKESFVGLANEGYTIIHSSDKMHQISAKNSIKSLGYDKLTVNIVIVNKVKGSKAILTGTWHNSFFGDQKAEWIGGKHSNLERAFAEIVKIANQLSGTISYSK